MTSSRSRSFPLILTVLLFACIAALSIIKTGDADAWLHLSFGKVIWQTKGLPATDPFLPAMAREPFSYSSWLFGLLYYGAYSLFDTYGVIALKALSVMTIFAVLLKDSLLPHRNHGIAAATLVTIAICMQGRFVERPDTFMLIFLSYSIMALNAYLVEGDRRWCYALPFIHMLWANCHSSINLMFVPFIAVFAGGTLASVLSRKGIETAVQLDVRQARFLGAILAASLLCALATPYGFSQFTFGYNFLKQDVYKQEIVELMPTVWLPGLKWYFVLVGVTAASFLPVWRRPSLPDLLRILPFLYLGFMSRRFIYVFAVVAAPVLIRNLSRTLELLPRPAPRLHSAGAVVAVLWMAGWTAASWAQVGPLHRPGAIPGFGFDISRQPEGALKYMDRRNLTGRVYNPFQWGQYIEWRDFPRRIPFIDGRGYLPPDLLEKVMSNTDVEQLADRWDIDIFLMPYPTLTGALASVTDRDVALDLPEWALVYWDDTALVYVRRGGKYADIARTDQYHFAKPANGLKAVEAAAKDPLQAALLVRELRRNIGESGSSRGAIMLANAYMAMGENRLAIETLLRVKEKVYQRHVYAAVGQCCEQAGDEAQAVSWYRKSLDEQENAEVHYRLGALLLKRHDTDGAIRHLKRSVAMNESLYEAHPKLAEAYRAAGKEEEAVKVMAAVKGSAKAKEYFDMGVKSYVAGNVPEAAEYFKKAIACGPTIALSHANLGFMQSDMGQAGEAYDSFQRALQLDQNCALAHYGVAMIRKSQGDTASAREHLNRYLEIEPTGYYSRMVKKELQNM